MRLDPASSSPHVRHHPVQTHPTFADTPLGSSPKPRIVRSSRHTPAPPSGTPSRSLRGSACVLLRIFLPNGQRYRCVRRMPGLGWRRTADSIRTTRVHVHVHRSICGSAGRGAREEKRWTIHHGGAGSQRAHQVGKRCAGTTHDGPTTNTNDGNVPRDVWRCLCICDASWR